MTFVVFFSGVSTAWRKLYRQSKKYLKFNLHVTNPFLVGSLSLWHKSYSTLRLIDTAGLSRGPKMDLTEYHDYILQSVNSKKEHLKTVWLQVRFSQCTTYP